jgi:predicted transposase YdaD
MHTDKQTHRGARTAAPDPTRAPAADHLSALSAYLVEDRERLREQAPLAYGQIQQAPLPESARRQCLDVFQSWLLARFQDQTLEEILIMLGEMTPLEQTRAYREIVAKNKPIWKQEGEAGLILRLLRRRLGSLTKNQQARVQSLPVEQLEDLGEALLDFSAAADLETWLATHPTPQQNA